MLELFDRLAPGSKGQLIRLAKSFGSQKLAKNAEKIAATLLEIAGDENEQEETRIDAAAQLIGLMSEDDSAAADLLQAITPRTAQTTAVGMIDALRDSRAENVGDVLLTEMDRFTPTTRAAGLRVMLARPETTKTLLRALDEKRVAREELTLDQQQALLASQRRNSRSRDKGALRIWWAAQSRSRQSPHLAEACDAANG